MRKRRVTAARFHDNEMAHIITYLYFINYFDKPGNATRGRELSAKKGCSQCHMLEDRGGSTGPDLRSSQAVGSPIETVTACGTTQARWDPKCV